MRTSRIRSTVGVPLAVAGCMAWCAAVRGGDWERFRGPGGSGVADGAHPPVVWAPGHNLLWRVDLPGPGTSSPILVGDRIYVTAYSGYGVDPGNPGRIEDLRRHLVCVEAGSGAVRWTRTVAAELPEDFYNRQLGEHGYASHTPVSDGERVFVFFGKTGVMAFDMDGTEVWQASVGHESGPNGWGSASSLALHGGRLFVTAAEESQSVRALDPGTGRELWKAEAASLDTVYNTPVVGVMAEGPDELLISVPGEIWALSVEDGSLLWYVVTGFSGTMNASVIVSDGVAYASGGSRGGGMVAVRLGGRGDVTESHVLWTSRRGPDFGTPVLSEGRLYWVNSRGVATCLAAGSGRVLFEARLESEAEFPRFYASPVVAEGRIYQVSRNAGTFVLDASPEFGQLAQNRIPDDRTDFNATPAVAGSRLYLRSNRSLYCVGTE